LERVAAFVRQHSVPAWMHAIQDENPMKGRRRRLKLHVQFALVSSEYHLCILNDIHSRSPSQSPLRALETSQWQTSNNDNPAQMETSWIFQYATTATLRQSDNPVNVLASACYQSAQDLIPVLQNLRGVAANKEFFQRDNYRVLVQARRSLVTDMEKLYQQQPSLAAVHRVLLPTASSTGTSTGKKPMDVVLEGALLSLGRCLDLVRPAGRCQFICLLLAM